MTTGGSPTRASAGGEASPRAATVATTAATTETPVDAVVVGRVDGAYGVHGGLRVEPFNDPQDSVLLRSRRWYLSAPARLTGEASVRGALPFRLPALVEVSRCRVHAAGLVATVAGIGTKEAADALRGCEIAVSRADFPPARGGEYYWVDLIGCAVVTPAGVPLGIVASVDDHGAHPLLRLRAEDGRERLIPFVEVHVPEVDVVGRRIVADWDPEF